MSMILPILAVAYPVAILASAVVSGYGVQQVIANAWVYRNGRVTDETVRRIRSSYVR